MWIDGLLDLLYTLSPSQLRTVRKVLLERNRPSISQLSDDIHACISEHMSPDDRVSFLRALYETPCRRTSATLVARAPSVSLILIHSIATQRLVKAIHEMADRILYTIPRYFTMYRTHVFCDWTPFSSRRPWSCAEVRVLWNMRAPHARVDIHRKNVERIVTDSIRAHRHAVRLTAHVETDTRPEAAWSSTMIRLKGRARRLCATPVHVRATELFSDVDWVDLECVYRKQALKRVRRGARRRGSPPSA